MATFNYTLLETARKLRQKTQKEVAEQTGISQSALSKAERGLATLPDSAMRILGQYYDLPLEFFTNDEIMTPVGHLYFRRKLTIPDKVIDSFVAKVQIFKMIVDKLMDPIDLPKFDIEAEPTDENNSPEDIADKMRYKFGIFKGPVPSLAKLLEAHGVIIIKFDFGTDKIDGLTNVTNYGRKVMFINQSMPNDRIRFSMAHELGHLIMHVSVVPRNKNLVEEEADRFASELLMPAKEIRQDLQGLTIPLLGQLKRKWRVSMRALTRRAKDLGTITSSGYRNLQITFSKKGWTKQEPIILPLEKPQLFQEALQLYRDELGYSDQELMKVMNLNEKDFHDWFVKRPKIISML